MSDDYSVAEREQAEDYMAEYPGFGELRSFGGAVDSEQVAFSWRLMPPGRVGAAATATNTRPRRRSCSWSRGP